jgi:RNA polymerase sigma-70 factor (ECF subfamily)
MPFHISPKKVLTDDELLEKFKEHGDLDVLGQLYERYMHLVYGVCLKYYKDREQAQDGVMEIFEKLIKELPDKEVNNFKPWLYVVTKNHCLMAIRHQKSIQTQMHKIQIDQSVFMENSFDWHPFENNGQEHMEDLLQICLNKLKAQQKSCIEQFYLEKKCYKEISDNLNLDVKKVKSFIQNGKRNLKICLDGAHEK